MKNTNRPTNEEAPQTNGSEIEIPAEGAIAADHRNPRRRRDRNRESAYGDDHEVGVLIETSERDNLADLVLHEDCRADIKSGIRAISIRADLERVWNIGKILPQEGRCILNFFGEPGTGKTRAARAIARLLGKNLYQVDYSAVISKYLGDTAKHIAQAFKRAKELNAVLFFDEADSLLSKRLDMNESCSTSINQNRNVLMQELDRFDGVVIVTTNLFKNYDPALLRRIARHIKFELPDQAMRKRLFEMHLPNLKRVSADLSSIAIEARGLSGGDILNVCVNAMLAGSVSDNTNEWKVTAGNLIEEIEKVLDAKAEHTSKSRPVSAN